MARPLTVAIAGAGGFVGSALAARLVADGARVIALGRAAPAPTLDGSAPIERRQADLFSLLQVELALAGADVGVYLVHSMMPAAQLTQGRFDDLDLVLADNFARAAKAQGLKRIVYLGGLIPASRLDLSRHLESRLEVERVLGSTGIPVTTLRAGLIVGPGGSSLEILVKLVRRLPVMLCPRWMRSRCQPIALADAVQLLAAAIQDTELLPGPYDIGGPNVLTYESMLRLTAAVLGVRRPMLPSPWFNPGLSSLWVAMVTGTSLRLVRPLVESLQHDMVAADRRLNERYAVPGQDFEASLRDAQVARVKAPIRRGSLAMSVCSVQRVVVPPETSAEALAAAYASWVSSFLRPLIDVRVNADGGLRFDFRPFGFARLAVHLLDLEYSRARSSSDRALFYIRGGVLASPDPKLKHAGRLEFRLVPGRPEAVVAVLDFRPTLPWWLYKVSQAVAHSFVMKCFSWHMRLVVKRRRQAGVAADARSELPPR